MLSGGNTAGPTRPGLKANATRPDALVGFDDPVAAPAAANRVPLRVTMTVTRPGSPDGRSRVSYVEGQSYDFRTPSEVDLGDVFIREGWARPTVEALALPAEPDTAKQAPAPSATKRVPRPRTKRGKK